MNELCSLLLECFKVFSTPIGSCIGVLLAVMFAFQLFHRLGGH